MNLPLFIDAKNDVTRKNAQSYLEDVHIEKITKAYQEFKDVDGFAKVVSNKDIIYNNKSKLSLKRYVRPVAATSDLSFEESVHDWSIASSEARTSIELLMGQIE